MGPKSTSKPPPRSSRLFFSVRCWNCARAAAPAAPFALCSISRPKLARIHARRCSEYDVPLDQVKRRQAASSSRRKKFRGRHRARRSQLGGRIDGDRRVDPIEKHAGDKVIGATVNGTGWLLMRAERVAAKLCWPRSSDVSEAQRSRAPIQRLVGQGGRVVCPIVLVSAVITSSCGLCTARNRTWRMPSSTPCRADHRVSVRGSLGDACRHHGGTGRGARAGILIKNAER